MSRKNPLLTAALIVFGLAFCLIYPLSIVWPSGFALVSTPEPALVDGVRGVVARAGDAVMFQVSRAIARGTFQDPYFASGILVAGDFPNGDWPSAPAFSGCYPMISMEGPAEWWLDPASLPLGANTELVHAIVRETSCASGFTAADRVRDPVVTLLEAAVVVSFSVSRRPGPQTCEPNPEFPIEFLLPEALGNRPMFDASTSPPRDATIVPEPIEMTGP